VLTIFAIPKPFSGKTKVIQRNAIQSWKKLHHDCQVILCGDEPGVAEVVAELDVEWIADIERNDYGTPLVSSAFRKAEERARHDVLCYTNADLIFLPDLLSATRRVAGQPRFLLVGQAWDLDVEREILEDANWERELGARATHEGQKRGYGWIDFFVFRRGTIGSLPDFAVGRPIWDNWMIWHARSRRIPVIDITASTLVIHQKHGYDHIREARGDRWEGPEADTNRALLQLGQGFTLYDATHRLEATGLVRTPSVGLKHRLRTELLLHSWTLPLYRALHARPRRSAGAELTMVLEPSSAKTSSASDAASSQEGHIRRHRRGRSRSVLATRIVQRRT
jgi:hypothetical protein